MAAQSFKKIIDFAIKREEEAIKTYGDYGRKAKSPGLKKLLAELQGEEKNHKKLLQNITKEKIGALEIKEVTDLKISDYLVEEKPSADMSFQDVLILAAKKEQKAARLYADLKKKVKKAELKKLFEFLVQQEKSHKLKLEEEYEKHVMEWD
jgi:rubrerythrin